MQIQSMLEQFAITKVTAMVDGGGERQDSVAACIEAHDKDGIVLVHDAARPFIRRTVIAELVKVADEHGAAIAGVRVKDTMKYAAGWCCRGDGGPWQVMDHPDAPGISICFAERGV